MINKDLNKWEITGVIICGYPGIGKSTAAVNRTDIVDAESSAYSHPFNYETGKHEKNDEFPRNYVEQIKKLASRIGGYQYVLASCHKEVREELDAQSIPYIVVIPDVECKDEYMKRYLKRGDSAEFIAQMYANWEEWHDEIEHNAPVVIHLGAGENLSDILPCK